MTYDPEWLEEPTSNPEVTNGDILKALLIVMSRPHLLKQEERDEKTI